MNWSFLNPYLLWALPLIGVPVLIHLLNRKKAIRHRFAAMEFILKSIQKQKRFHLKSLLLLLCRCFSLLLLILAISGLVQQNELKGEVKGDLPKSVVIMLDVSGSMGWRGQRGLQNLDQAKKQALRLIDSLSEADEVGVLLFDQKIIYRDPRLRMGKVLSRKKIHSAKATSRGTHIGDGLTSALLFFQDASFERREIHMFTDMAETGWVQHDFPKLEDWQAVGNPSMYIHSVQSLSVPGNLSLQHVKVKKDPSAQGNYTISAEIINWGDQPVQDVPIVLSIDGKEIIRSFRNIKAGEQDQVSFSYQLPVGKGSQQSKILIGDLQIQNDPLVLDNRRWFLLQSPRTVHVLLVDGDVQPDPLLSETYYAFRALQPVGKENAPILPTKKTLREFRPQDLKDQDVVMLCNVAQFTNDHLEGLRQFVYRGGTLWLTLGDQVEIDYYNKIFSDLLPGLLRDIRTEAKGTSLASIPQENPIFSGFLDRELLYFNEAKFFKYFVLESFSAQDSKTHLRFVSGSPALVEKKVRKGKVLLWTSSIDRSWSDFALQTTFVPFIHDLSLFFSVGIGQGKFWQGQIGEELSLDLVSTAQQVVIRSPKNELWQLLPEDLGSQKKRVKFSEGHSAGVYQVEIKTLKQNLQKFLLLHPPGVESNLKTLSNDEVGSRIPTKNVHIQKSSLAEEKWASSAAPHMMSWVPFLLAGLTLLIVTESWISSI